MPEYQIKQTRRNGRRIFALAVFLLLVFGAGFLVYAYAKVHRPTSSVSVPVTFSVPQGATTREVGTALKEKSLITSNLIFVGYALMEGASGKIQAGDYALDRNMSMKDILGKLTSGNVTRNTKRVTIVEGANNKQVQKALVDAGLVTAGQFEDAVSVDYDFDFNPSAREQEYEGYLFPDTYQFDATWNAEQIIGRMLQNFESKITAQMRADIEEKNLDMSEVVILASIVEREVGRASSVQLTEEVRATLQREREQVASVFFNRLEIGMPLQSDATVNYATGKSDRRALLSDLEIDSPYNTYKYAGLPPGPISNPGINSLRAVIYPADTNYLYFLNNKEGVAYFGRTLEEHNSNRARYLD